MLDQKIRWGILGCANIAKKAFIPALLKANNAILYGIASRGDHKKLAEFASLFTPKQTYTSYEAMLKDPNIDAIYIPLPNGLHKEWTIKALNHKKAVLCEKPLGISALEVEEIFQAAEANQRPVMEAFAYRHSPLIYKIKDLIDQGAIGQLRHMEATFTFSIASEENVRLHSDLKGGATFDIGCYNLNLFRFIANGSPISLRASGKIGSVSQVDEESLIHLTYRNGVTASSFCSFRVPDRSEAIFLGTKGILKSSNRYNAEGKAILELTTEGNQESIIVDCPNNYTLEAEQMGRILLEKETPLLSFKESLDNASTIQAALDQIFAQAQN